MRLRRSLREVANLSAMLGVALLALTCSLAIVSAVGEDTSGGIRVEGPGVRPELGFACCDQGIAQMQSLLASPDVIADLKELHAEVAIPILDFSPERVAAVRELNQAGIPVIAWMEMSKEEGFYLNADNAPEAAARVATFEKWTDENGLKWEAVGLDIEPNFNEFASLKGHRWHLITMLLRQSLNGRRVQRAKQAYAALIRGIQAQGYPVQTYQMPYLPAERSVHSTLLDRMLGTVDVRGNEEYLMLYTNNARQVGAGMIWSLGRNAQGITVGSTDGPGAAGSGSGPLDWEEFSRDLIVASHFTKHIGVYNLEGCVRQGFLPRLRTMNWSESVVIPRAAVVRAERLGFISRAVLWVGSNLLYLVLAGVLLVVWLWRVHKRRKKVLR